MEGLLIRLLVGLLVFGVIMVALRIFFTANDTFPGWMAQITYLILSAAFLIFIIYLVVPLIHVAF